MIPSPEPTVHHANRGVTKRQQGPAWPHDSRGTFRAVTDKTDGISNIPFRLANRIFVFLLDFKLSCIHVRIQAVNGMLKQDTIMTVGDVS